jgi:hypothetical protein
MDDPHVRITEDTFHLVTYSPPTTHENVGDLLELQHFFTKKFASRSTSTNREADHTRPFAHVAGQLVARMAVDATSSTQNAGGYPKPEHPRNPCGSLTPLIQYPQLRSIMADGVGLE